MKDISTLIDVLKSQKHDGEDYYIPKSWNYVGIQGTQSEDRPGEISVNPFRFYAACLETTLSAPAQKLSADLKSSLVYSLMPRAFSAWRHGEDGIEIHGGTLLKTMALLPLLIQRGVDTVYLLPVFTTSGTSLKGELPSPYAVGDIMTIDAALHDPHLPGVTPEEEFYALVTLCHHLGIRVMLDFVLRTAARDNILIQSHPEWFYWVDSEKAGAMGAPEVEDLPHEVVCEENIPLLYSAPDMKAHVGCFMEAPERAEWKDILEESAFLGEPLMAVSAQRLRKETLPAFPDTINDPQPTWSDITYYRMYFDNSPAAAQYFPGVHTPFLVQDGVQTRLFPGKLPNFGLWRYLEAVIPHYIETYGIDGARIDMAHTLPADLVKTIIDRSRESKPEFIFWSEEFETQYAPEAAEEGYDFILGELCFDWDALSADDFGSLLFEHIDSALPVTAALETADTPRALGIMESSERLEAVLWIAALVPNAVLFINNGMEMGERQPMNLGLLNTEEGRYTLPDGHPLYGKLAFFDNYCFDWTADDAGDFCERLLLISRMRKVYADLLQPEHLDLRLMMADTPVLVLKYQTGDKRFLAVVNRTDRPFHVVPEKLIDGERKVLYAKRATVDGTMGGYGVLVMASLLRPGETPKKKKKSAEFALQNKTEPAAQSETPVAAPKIKREPVPDGMLPDFARKQEEAKKPSKEKRVAYFSMEFALDAALQTYAGELGVLAGDVLKTAKDMGKPVVGVGILWRQGSGRQLIAADGKAIDCFPENRYEFLKDTGVQVSLPIRGREVTLKIWLCERFGSVPLYLLDAAGNEGSDRLLTGQIYGGFEEERVAQEMILGIGGVLALQELGIEVDVYHLADSHPLFAGIKLMADQVGFGCLFEQAYERIKNKLVYTMNTAPVTAGETYSLELLEYMGAGCGLTRREMEFLGGSPFHMTTAALRMSYAAHGVSVKHGQNLSRAYAKLPGVPQLSSITSGLHISSWMDRAIAEAVQNRSDLLIPHTLLKKRLFEEIKRHSGRRLKEDVLTIGLARRVTTAKRNTLLFREFDRLEPLISSGKLQIVLSGKAHPGDLEGKRLVAQMYKWSIRYPEAIAFMQDYDLNIGRLITRGCDVWLNMPRRGTEACGVSGIKAAMNGALMLGVPDGWWAEACDHGVNGWQIGSMDGGREDEKDAARCAELITEEILPLYEKNPDQWRRMMRESIKMAYKQFSSARMLSEYYTKLYNTQKELEESKS